jgi:hypothetical protein
MYDAHDRSTLRKVISRKARSSPAEKFSPSFGVHQGMIPDPNWPPAEFPEGNVAMQRKDRRVTCSFTLEVDGRRREVTGDLSRGGAMFLLPARAAVQVVMIELRGVRAEAQVLSTNARNNQVAHHAQFIDPEAAKAVWKKLLS